MRTPHAAGSASALLGTSSFLIGAVASPLVGIAGRGHRRPDGRRPTGGRTGGARPASWDCAVLWNRRATTEGAES